MIRFTIRDVLWLTVVVAMGAAWWAERRIDAQRHATDARRADRRTSFLLQALDDYGFAVKETDAGFLSYPKPKGVEGTYLPPAPPVAE